LPSGAGFLVSFCGVDDAIVATTSSTDKEQMTTIGAANSARARVPPFPACFSISKRFDDLLCCFVLLGFSFQSF
jgi:hypothetical protein